MAQQNPKKRPQKKQANHSSHEASLEARIKAALYRQECPEVMVLGDYQIDLLTETETKAIEAHLDRCPYCRAELARLAEFIAGDAAEIVPAWQESEGVQWRQVKESGTIIIKMTTETVAKARRILGRALRPPADPLAFEGIRSGKLDWLYEISFTQGGPDFEAALTLERSRQTPDHCDVTVKVNIPSRGGWPNLANTRVTLKRRETAPVTRPTNAFGQTTFKNVPLAQLSQLSFEIAPGEDRG